MSIDVSQIKLGTCYRTAVGELRQVRGLDADAVTYVVIFHALRRTSVGPLERMPIADFAYEAAREEACP